MAAVPDLSAPNRKRQFEEADLAQEFLSVRPSKKSKLKKNHHSASTFPPPEFWDSLSKVWLTPRALRELDRRNHLQCHTRAQRAQRVQTRAQTQAQASTGQFTNENELRRFARHGGADLSDLRGLSEPSNIDRVRRMSSKRSSRSSGRHGKSTNPSSSSTSRTSNTSGRRSSAYDADFEQHLCDNHINLNSRKSKPDNVEQMRQRLAQARPSLSPSRFSATAFEEFQRRNEDVIDEGEVMRDVLPMVYGNADIPHKENLLFTRLESITDKVTVDAKPDFYDGAPTDSLDEQVRTDLSRFIVPTPHRTAPIAANFFLEAKAPKGGADVAKRQITHDLALGARGMHQLQSYAAGMPVFDNNAYTLGATYHAGTGTLQMYTSHVTPGPDGSSEYHTTQIGAHALAGDPDTFRRGAAALRNGRDMMKEYRDQFISTANERARSTLDSSTYSGLSHTSYSYLGEESHTSADEPAATSFYTDTQPELFEDELAGNSIQHLVSASDDFATSFSQPATTSFAYIAKSDDDGLSYIQEESETSTDELAKLTSNPVPSKRPLKGRKRVSETSRTVHRAGVSPGHQSVPSAYQSSISSTYQSFPPASQLATSSVYRALSSASQLATSSAYQVVPSTCQSYSITQGHLSATTAQYESPLSSSMGVGEARQYDNGDNHNDREAKEADNDYQVGGDIKVHQAASSSWNSKYCVVRLTKRTSMLGRDEFTFRDSKGKTRYTKQKDWQKITFQGQAAWAHRRYISYHPPE